MKRWLSWVHIFSTFFQVVDIELSGHESDQPLISCNTTAIIIMKLNLSNTVNNEERGHGQQSVVWFKCSWPCFITSMYSVQSFPGGHSLCLAFGSLFYPLFSPHPFILPPINQCDRCIVPLAWGLMAGGCRFACAKSGSPWTSGVPTSTK